MNMEKMTHKEKNKLIKDLYAKIEGFSLDIDIFIDILDREGLLNKYYDENGDFLPGAVHKLYNYQFQKLQQKLQQWVDPKTI